MLCSFIWTCLQKVALRFAINIEEHTWHSLQWFAMDGDALCTFPMKHCRKGQTGTGNVLLEGSLALFKFLFWKLQNGDKQFLNDNFKSITKPTLRWCGQSMRSIPVLWNCPQPFPYEPLDLGVLDLFGFMFPYVWVCHTELPKKIESLLPDGQPRLWLQSDNTVKESLLQHFFIAIGFWCSFLRLWLGNALRLKGCFNLNVAHLRKSVMATVAGSWQHWHKPVALPQPIIRTWQLAILMKMLMQCWVE